MASVGSIKYSEQFLRRVAKLPKRIQAQAQVREEIFRIDPFDHRLGTHKLHGKYREEWAFSIAQQYRIKFMFVNDNTVIFTDVGTHPEVYR